METHRLNRLREKAFVCHSEARLSPKNLSVYWACIEEGFFASLRMTAKLSFSAASKVCATYSFLNTLPSFITKFTLRTA